MGLAFCTAANAREFDDEIFEGRGFENGESKDGSAEVAGAASGVVSVKDHGEGFKNEVADGEGSHFERDHEEEENAGIRCNKAEGGEDAEESGRSSDHLSGGGVAVEEPGEEVEEGVEKCAGGSAEKVKDKVCTAGHPAFEVRSEEEEADAV